MEQRVRELERKAAAAAKASRSKTASKDSTPHGIPEALGGFDGLRFSAPGVLIPRPHFSSFRSSFQADCVRGCEKTGLGVLPGTVSFCFGWHGLSQSPFFHNL